MQRLHLRERARGELAEKFDVVGRREGLEHRSHLVAAACARQFTVVVGKRGVDGVQPPAYCRRIGLAGLREVAPEDERMSLVAAWARRKQVAWSDDRRARTSRMHGDTEFPFDTVRIDT